MGRSPLMTNNIAEWGGLRAALTRMLDEHESGGISGDKLLIFGDSQLVIRQLSGRWKIKAMHLQAYRDECLDLLKQIGLPWEAKWVPRKENQEADSLAEEAVQIGSNSRSMMAVI